MPINSRFLATQSKAREAVVASGQMAKVLDRTELQTILPTLPFDTCPFVTGIETFDMRRLYFFEPVMEDKFNLTNADMRNHKYGDITGEIKIPQEYGSGKIAIKRENHDNHIVQSAKYIFDDDTPPVQFQTERVANLFYLLFLSNSVASIPKEMLQRIADRGSVNAYMLRVPRYMPDETSVFSIQMTSDGIVVKEIAEPLNRDMQVDDLFVHVFQ